MKRVVWTALIVMAVASPMAFAQENASQDCKARLEALGKEYAATGLSAPPKPAGGVVQGKEGHRHPSADLTAMRNHFMQAQHLCKQGKEHESMLHQDVVRALLKLPEVQHPAEHHYVKPPQ